MKIRFESNSNNQGFSLIELIVVLIITAILAQLGFVSFNRYQRKTKAFAAKTALMNVRRECETNRDLGLDTNFTLLNPNGYLINSRSNNNCLGEENSGYVVANPNDLNNFPRYFYDFNNGTIFCMNPSGVNFFPECLSTQLNQNKKSNLIKKEKLSFKTNEIASNLDAPMHVELGDMDGDGDLDFVVTSIYDGAVRWFENDGSGKPSFTSHDVITGDGFKYGVSLADMDGDGDMDIVSSGNKLTWYENDGSPNPSYTPRDIPKAGGTGREIALADMDGDGDMDIVDTSGSSDTVKWYENDGSPNPSFKEISIDTDSNGAQDVHVDDIDGDGDVDIIVAAQDAGTVEWYENKGGSNPNWGKTLIASDLKSVTGVSVADIDGDGDLDILSSSQGDSKIAWYENNGRSNPSFKSKNIAVDPPGPVKTDINGNPPAENVGYAADVRVADMDGDGDLDVITSNYEGTYHVYKNDGSSNPSWDKNVLAQRSRRNVQLFEMGHGDVDGDGDIDVVGVSRYEGSVFWYENE